MLIPLTLFRYYEQIIVCELANHDHFVHLETTLLLNRVVVCLLDKCTMLYFLTLFNQLDAQNVFHNEFYFMPIHVSSTCAHHQEVKIALHSIWYHHTYRCECDDIRGCVMQF